MTTRRLAVLLMLLACAGTAEAAPATARIGDLLLDYDDAGWRVATRPDGAEITAIECDVPRCDDDGTNIAVTIVPPDGPLPTAIPRREAGFVQPLWDLLADVDASGPRDDPVRAVNGFLVFATDRWSGCRAMSPSELTAILDHQDRRYTFTSGVARGCRGVWGVPREDFVAVLSGLRPAP